MLMSSQGTAARSTAGVSHTLDPRELLYSRGMVSQVTLIFTIHLDNLNIVLDETEVRLMSSVHVKKTF